MKKLSKSKKFVKKHLFGSNAEKSSPQQYNRRFAFSKIVFCAGTKVFEEALNAVKFWGWPKKFGRAQNILGPVKGQGTKVKEVLGKDILNPVYRF